MARRQTHPRPARVRPLPQPVPVPAASRTGIGRHGRAVALGLALLYLVGVSIYLLTHGGWPTPDYLIPPLLLVAIALGRGWPFVLDWAPFLLLVLSWQATAGVAEQLGRPVHMNALVRGESWLFGGSIPTIELQERFFDSSRAGTTGRQPFSTRCTSCCRSASAW
jgi:hypothetical protein